MSSYPSHCYYESAFLPLICGAWLVQFQKYQFMCPINVILMRAIPFEILRGSGLKKKNKMCVGGVHEKINCVGASGIFPVQSRTP